MAKKTQEQPQGGERRHERPADRVDRAQAEILKQAEASRQNTALLYFSDHGTVPENPFERFSTVPDMVEVPMFYWLSPLYRKTPLAKSAQTLSTLKKTTTSESSFIINALSGIKIKTDSPTEEPL